MEKDYGEKQAGNYIININMANYRSGIYYYSIVAYKISLTRSMVFLK